MVFCEVNRRRIDAELLNIVQGLGPWEDPSSEQIVAVWNQHNVIKNQASFDFSNSTPEEYNRALEFRQEVCHLLCQYLKCS